MTTEEEMFMGRKKSAFIAMILTFVMIVSTCVPTFALNMPETYANYIEPFFGK